MEKFTDQSNQGEIARLQNAVASLGDRLATVEPAQAAPKADSKAEKAAKKARDEAVADLCHRLEARLVHLGRLDSLVTEVCEVIRDERECRADLVKSHGSLIEKELRRIIASDTAIVLGLQRRLGDAIRPPTAHQQPELSVGGKQLHAMILQHLQTDDLDALLS